MVRTLRTLRVLLTGFTKIASPDFDLPRDSNPSGEVAKAANDWPPLRGIYRTGDINTGQVKGVVYDVLFSADTSQNGKDGVSSGTTAGAADLLEADILRIRPDVVISMGFAPGADYFRLERNAYDNDGGTADNRGFRPKEGRRQYPNEPYELKTKLPFSAIERAWDDMKIPYVESDTAGDYVCNDVFYRLMRTANAKRSGTPILKAGFIHVPDPLKMAQPKVNDAIKAAVERTLASIDPATYETLPATTRDLRHG